MSEHHTTARAGEAPPAPPSPLAPLAPLAPIIVLEGPAGLGRRAALEQRAARARAAGARTWVLPCDFRHGGPWAGAAELFAGLYDEILPLRPDLVTSHDYELVTVLPALRRTLAVRHMSLTDLAPSAEKVRSYPADRAYRIVHGLVDFLLSYKEMIAGRWVLCCDAYDRGGRIGSRFFRELGRRIAGRTDLCLLLAVEPAAAAAVAAELAGSVREVLALDLMPEPAEPPKPSRSAELTAIPGAPAGGEMDAGAARREALALEARGREDRALIEAHLADLIRWWELAGDHRRALQWRREALETYNRLGLYEDALVYGEEVWRAMTELGAGDGLRWDTFNKIVACHIALQSPFAAFEMADRMLAERLQPDHRSQLHYLLAMLHARFLPRRDLVRAEGHLMQCLEELAKAGLDEEEYWFRYVFNQNGLALIRHLGGRPDEAIELCRTGFELLQEHLAPSRHQLHRSVLLYNIAQVLTATGSHEEAVRYFSAAIEADPNYSEYYNERGNVFLKMDRLEEAARDYSRAIELSPPYFEVLVNLGQCQRRSGSPERAIESYGRALELNPGHGLALLGRAQAREMCGRLREAIADYTAALALDPSQWEALANRASLHFELGAGEQALVDISAAIALAPEQADLYQAREVALTALGRHEEAAADRRAFARLSGAPR